MSAEPLTIPALGRGRPSVASLMRSLERARLVNTSLREQLRAERSEARTFAGRVVLEVANVKRGLLSPDGDIAIDQAANALGYAAARHIRQREPGAPA